MQWEKEFEIAKVALFRAEEKVKGFFGNTGYIKDKGIMDPVTEADLESEKVIISTIRDHFPEDTIISEERGKEGGGSERVWIIDPLDGTINFSHGFPLIGISIAFEIEGKTVLGLVSLPYTNERFIAIKGKGAFLGKERINVSEVSDLAHSLLATGFPYDIYEGNEEPFKIFYKVMKHVQGVRRPGSAVFDLCYVAKGIFDGFWEMGLKPWDTAAGALLVSEAGGMVSDFQGNPFSPYSKSIIASNPYIYEDLIQIISSG